MHSMCIVGKMLSVQRQLGLLSRTQRMMRMRKVNDIANKRLSLAGNVGVRDIYIVSCIGCGLVKLATFSKKESRQHGAERQSVIIKSVTKLWKNYQKSKLQI